MLLYQNKTSIFSKIHDPMKRQIIRIVMAIGSANSIVISCPGNKNDVGLLELPIHILKSVIQRIGMKQNLLFHIPFFQVLGSNEIQLISHTIERYDTLIFRFDIV